MRSILLSRLLADNPRLTRRGGGCLRCGGGRCRSCGKENIRKNTGLLGEHGQTQEINVIIAGIGTESQATMAMIAHLWSELVSYAM